MHFSLPCYTYLISRLTEHIVTPGEVLKNREKNCYSVPEHLPTPFSLLLFFTLLHLCSSKLPKKGKEKPVKTDYFIFPGKILSGRSLRFPLLAGTPMGRAMYQEDPEPHFQAPITLKSVDRSATSTANPLQPRRPELSGLFLRCRNAARMEGLAPSLFYLVRHALLGYDSACS